jgi:hypothetical protein
LIVTDLEDKIEIGPGVTVSIPFGLDDDYVSFQIFDMDNKTQDLVLSCWFSRIVPFENPVRFNSFDFRKNVQQKKSLVMYGKAENTILPENSPKGHVVTLENGQHYLNVQNMAGQYKKFIVKKNSLNN